MRDVHVAADDDRLCFVQLFDIGAEIVLPLHPVVQPLEAVLRIGHIDRDEIKVVVFRRDDPTLVVVQVNAQIVGDSARFGLGKERGARIALLLGRAPVFMIALDLRRLFGLELGLLQAHHIGLFSREELKKALAHAGAQAVDIPRDQFHIRTPFGQIISEYRWPRCGGRPPPCARAERRARSGRSPRPAGRSSGRARR